MKEGWKRMTDIKKIFQILFKRNILWIFTIALIFLILEGSSATYQSNEGFISQMLYDFYDLDLIDVKDGKVINPNYEDLDMDFEKFKNEHRAGVSDDYISIRVKKLNKILEIMGTSRVELEEENGMFNEVAEEKYEKYGESFSIVNRITSSVNSNSIVKDSSDGQYKLNFSDKIIRPNLFIYIIVFIIGVLLLSGEHLTRYYEFSKMFPWSKTKTYLGKILFGFIIVMGVWLISAGLKYAIFSKSTYNNIIIAYEPMKNFVFYGFNLLAFYSIVMGVGALAGNFIGHIGLTGMALLGIRLYQYNLDSLERLVTASSYSNISANIADRIDHLNNAFKVIVSPFDGFILNNEGMGVFIGLLALSILYLALGIYWTKTAKTERSQMLVLKGKESKFVRFMAIITTANIVGEISFSLSTSWIASILIFAITLAIAYKFYQILFKSRIGFQS